MGRVGLHISLWNGFCRRLSGALWKIILHPWGSNRNDTMIINVFLFKNVKGWSFGAGLPISDELCTLFYIFFTFFFSFALIFVSNVYCQDKNYINLLTIIIFFIFISRHLRRVVQLDKTNRQKITLKWFLNLWWFFVCYYFLLR